MKKKRIIPIFLLNEMQLVQSRNFNDFEVIGNPFSSIKRFSEWMIDELIYLNITRIKNSEHEKNEIKKFTKLIQEISKHNFMPITIGGKIKNLNQIYAYLKNGADKISINSRAFKDPKFIMKQQENLDHNVLLSLLMLKK